MRRYGGDGLDPPGEFEQPVVTGADGVVEQVGAQPVPPGPAEPDVAVGVLPAEVAGEAREIDGGLALPGGAQRDDRRGEAASYRGAEGSSIEGSSIEGSSIEGSSVEGGGWRAHAFSTLRATRRGAVPLPGRTGRDRRTVGPGDEIEHQESAPADDQQPVVAEEMQADRDVVEG